MSRRARNPVSLAFSREAWLLLAENFSRVLDDPTDLAARGGMQLGACFAGLAIENSMLGATHALANPLTADYGIRARPGDRPDAAARDPLQRRRGRRLVSRPAGMHRRQQRLSAARIGRRRTGRFRRRPGPPRRPRRAPVGMRRRARSARRNWPPKPPSNGPAGSIRARSAKPNC